MASKGKSMGVKGLMRKVKGEVVPNVAISLTCSTGTVTSVISEGLVEILIMGASPGTRK